MNPTHCREKNSTARRNHQVVEGEERGQQIHAREANTYRDAYKGANLGYWTRFKQRIRSRISKNSAPVVGL
jgi:hypothetical protein